MGQDYIGEGGGKGCVEELNVSDFEKERIGEFGHVMMLLKGNKL